MLWRRFKRYVSVGRVGRPFRCRSLSRQSKAFVFPGAGVPLIERNERRESELDADFFGVQYLYKAGYDTQCFLDFVELVGDSNKGVSASLCTYPPIAKRLKLLQKEIAETSVPSLPSPFCSNTSSSP
jgi:hypothetical protein